MYINILKKTGVSLMGAEVLVGRYLLPGTGASFKNALPRTKENDGEQCGVRARCVCTRVLARTPRPTGT